ncbi:MAG: dihydroorotate dehydrogenase electron transfer subunit [Dehalococcoidales bacterium]
MDNSPEVAVSQVLNRVASSREVMPGVYLIWLQSPLIASAAKPGQFVMVRCGDSLLRRPFSIHQVDDSKKKLALLFSVVGRGTHWLSQRKKGDELDLLGPLGNGFTIHHDSHNLLLVAGGIGIAPLRFLIDETLEQGKEVTLLYGTVDRERYPVSPQIRLVSATEDGTVGHRGKVTDLLPGYIDWADQVFACGPTAMYRALALKRQELLGAKPVQISLEVRMACGLGVCYGCTVRTRAGLKQVCRDGPVFNLDDILWDGLVDV